MTNLLAIIRAVHFGACLLPLSVFATILLVVNPAAGRISGKAINPPDISDALERFHRQLRRLVVICFIAAFISGFCWLWFAIAGMSGTSLRESLQPDLFKLVLLQTQPGRVWIVRAVLLLLAAVALWICPEPGISKPRYFHLLPGALLAASLAGSLAWLGHAGAAEGPWLGVQLVADILHLIAAGFWPASLLPFALFLHYFLKSREPALLAIACKATHRFSSVSLAAVGVLAISGSINSWFLVGNFHALFTTEYGHFLTAKLLLFLAMITIGAVNLLRLKPRLPACSTPESAAADAATLKKIVRNVWIELWIGTAVLLIVGILGITPPALHS